MPKIDKKKEARTHPYSIDFLKKAVNSWKTMAFDFESKVEAKCKLIKKYIKNKKDAISQEQAAQIFELMSNYFVNWCQYIIA